MEAKVDRRTIKTKKAIRKAISELIAEKDVNKITVKDIADAADINRKTFYNYYSSVYDALNEIEQEIIDQIHENFGDLDLQRDLANPKQLLTKLNDIIEANIDFYRGYVEGSKNSSSIDSRLTQLMKDELKETALKYITPENKNAVNFAIEYICSGLVGAYREWLMGKSGMSLDELADHLGTLIFYGLNSFLKDQGLNAPVLQHS